MNPWRLAAEAINEVLHYTAFHGLEGPDKGQSYQLFTAKDVREVLISDVGPEVGQLEGLSQPVLRSQVLGPSRKWGTYLRPSRMKTRQLLTKMCLVFEMAAVPVMANCK